MSTHYENHLLIQTFVELDTQITHLTNRISSDRFVEIGDDPYLVQEIENILLRVQRKAKSIESFFDLTTTSMSRANVYFALIKRVSDTIRYLGDVRKKDYGCQQHTRELLSRLKDCAESIYAIGDLVTMHTENVQ